MFFMGNTVYVQVAQIISDKDLWHENVGGKSSRLYSVFISEMIQKMSESYKNCNVASFSKNGIPNMMQKNLQKSCLLRTK